jgi:metal-responsive CopG/Arc/MetJ family transcriptional regulator
MLNSDETKQNSMPRKHKEKISLTIDQGLLEWIDRQVENRTFKDRSHAVEKLIYDKMMEKKELG